jgi:hypothetical protein
MVPFLPATTDESSLSVLAPKLRINVDEHPA